LLIVVLWRIFLSTQYHLDSETAIILSNVIVDWCSVCISNSCSRVTIKRTIKQEKADFSENFKNFRLFWNCWFGRLLFWDEVEVNAALKKSLQALNSEGNNFFRLHQGITKRYCFLPKYVFLLILVSQNRITFRKFSADFCGKEFSKTLLKIPHLFFT